MYDITSNFNTPAAIIAKALNNIALATTLHAQATAQTTGNTYYVNSAAEALKKRID